MDTTRRRRRVLNLDVDETLISAPHLMTALDWAWEQAGVHRDVVEIKKWMRRCWVELKTWLGECFRDHGFLRPGTVEFLKGLRAWKEAGHDARKVVLFSMSANAGLWVDLVAETLNDMAEVKVLDLVVAREDVKAWYDDMARDEPREMPVVLPRGEIRKGVKPLAAVAWRLGLDADEVKFTVVDDLPQVVRGPCAMIPVTPFLGRTWRTRLP